MKNYLYLGFVCLLLACCKGDKNEIIKSKSYVLGYHNVLSLEALINTKNEIMLFTCWEEIKMMDHQRHTAEFNAINERHNDVSYNRKIRFVVVKPSIFGAQDFQQVSITSDADFDGSHKAGESLGDIARFLSVSPIKYIQSGYKAEYNWDIKTSQQKEFCAIWGMCSKKSFYDDYNTSNFFPVDSKVSELTPADLVLLGTGNRNSHRPDQISLGGQPLAVIQFLSQPTLEKEHRITVTFVDTQGKQYQAKPVTVKFN